MRFENGMLGFLIVVLAIGGSIFGTILLSAEESTHDVTKYKYETEITGLFPVDTSPEFYDYDLSRNYTGYYTPETEINGVKYFGGVDFKNTTVNNYSVKYAPEESETDTVTIEDLSQSDPPDDKRLQIVVYGEDGVETDEEGTMGNRVVNASGTTKCSTIISFIEANELDEFDLITIKPTSDDVSDRILFASTDDFVYIDNSNPFQMNDYYWRDYVEYDSRETYTQSKWGGITQSTLVACLSCKVDLITQTANFYYGTSPETKQFVRSVDLDKAVILYGTTSEFDIDGLSDEVDYIAENYPDVDYMDISRGVKVTGVGE